MSKLLPFAVTWVVSLLVLIALAAFRKVVSSKEDDSIHLGGSGEAVSTQLEIAKKLESIDRWGKIITILVVVSGLALGIWWCYLKFTAGGLALD